MKVNSRRLLPIFRSALSGDLALFRTNVGDFVICNPQEAGAALAFLSAIRPSHRSLRIDGVVGRATIDTPNSIVSKTMLPGTRFTHLLNLAELRDKAFLNEEHLADGIADFLDALGSVFDRLRAGEDLVGINRMLPRPDIFIAPLRVDA